MTKPSKRARARSCPTASDGYVLIELLVGMVLLALAVALLPGMLRLGLQAIRANGELQRSTDLEQALDVIEQRIASAIPVFERDREGRISITFTGDHDTLTFVGPSDSGPSGAGLYRHRLQPATTAGVATERRGLALRLTPYVPTPLGVTDPVASGQIRLLADQRVALRFRYFGAKAGGAPTIWHDSWQQTDALPVLVEVALDMSPDGPGPSRRLMVAPRLTVRP